MRQKTHQIRQFIIDHVNDHKADIAALTADRFGLTRQAISKHLQKLVGEEILEAAGNTRARTYLLRPIVDESTTYRVDDQLDEDRVWSESARPLLGDLPKNVLAICQYGITEMVNNVIDHSESTIVQVKVLTTRAHVDLRVYDRGIGIFKKVASSYRLSHEHDAILEIAKGKLTTDPHRHTGEGIFFTSRMFDQFDISSGKLRFVHYQPENDWLQMDDTRDIRGTQIRMIIARNSTRHPTDVFGWFTVDDDMTFSKTHVPITLAQYGTDNLVSRSQARKVLSRFDRFEEVLLDFANIPFIGQAFADEVFRVYRNAHPNVRLAFINANSRVAGMIGHVTKEMRQSDSAESGGDSLYVETKTPEPPPPDFFGDSSSIDDEPT